MIDIASWLDQHIHRDVDMPFVMVLLFFFFRVSCRHCVSFPLKYISVYFLNTRPFSYIATV